MCTRTAARFAWSIAGMATACEALSLLLLILIAASPGMDTYNYWLASAIMGIIFPAIGALIVSRYPVNALGWVFCLMGLAIGIGDLALEYATFALIAAPSPLPGAVAAAWVGSYAGGAGFVSMVLVPLLFPDGRPPSRGWWLVLWLTVGVIAVQTASYAVMPGPFEDHPSVENPLGIEGAGAVLDALLGVTNLAFHACLLAAVLSLVLRFRRSRGEERQQLKWFTWAVALGPFTLLGNELFPDLAWLIGGVSVVLLPVAIGMAVLRYRLYDIDLVINRTLVYGAMTASVIGLYVLVVGGLGTLLQARGDVLSLLAAGLVAVLFAPLRDRLQRGVNHLMYGARDDPYEVVARLGQRLKAATAPDAVLPTIVDTVAEALKLPYAAIAVKRDDGFVTVAARGSPAAHPLVVPLAYGADTIGQLVLAPRAPGESFGSDERSLLDHLARYAETAVYAVRLADDLQRSRERLVTTREEERRRLRRDLHDGLGPQLATLTLKLDAARNLLAHQPATADALLAELKGQTQTAIADIRRLVYDLRPPALDDLGLIPAIREQATRYSQNGLHVSVDAPTHVPPLPAAVEVAAYRIAAEALTNVAHHARASACRVRLAVGTELELEITDNGVGLPDDRRAGVGLTSMRERTAELGGTWVMESPPTGGTRVLARLPLPASGEQP